MPSDLSITATTLQRLVQNMGISLIPKNHTINLGDSIYIGGDIGERNVNLRLTLDHLNDAGLTLNRKKCRILQYSVNLTGHTFSSDGMAVSGARNEQVRTWMSSADQIEFRIFLGLSDC